MSVCALGGRRPRLIELAGRERPSSEEDNSRRTLVTMRGLVDAWRAAADIRAAGHSGTTVTAAGRAGAPACRTSGRWPGARLVDLVAQNLRPFGMPQHVAHEGTALESEGVPVASDADHLAPAAKSMALGAGVA